MQQLIDYQYVNNTLLESIIVRGTMAQNVEAQDQVDYGTGNNDDTRK